MSHPQERRRVRRAGCDAVSPAQAVATYRGDEYAVQLSVSNAGHHTALRVVCERLRDSALWSNDFTAECACPGVFERCCD